MKNWWGSRLVRKKSMDPDCNFSGKSMVSSFSFLCERRPQIKQTCGSSSIRGGRAVSIACFVQDILLLIYRPSLTSAYEVIPHKVSQKMLVSTVWLPLMTKVRKIDMYFEIKHVQIMPLIRIETSCTHVHAIFPNPTYNRIEDWMDTILTHLALLIDSSPPTRRRWRRVAQAIAAALRGTLNFFL